MERHERIEQVAALLDGEIRDTAQLEQLNTLLKTDANLRAEFEEQRSVKRLLTQAAQTGSPLFLETRVMGEIAARRRLQRGFKLRLAAAATGGFVFCLGALGMLSQYFTVGTAMAPTLAMRTSPVVQPGVFQATDALYGSQDWQAIAPPSDADPKVKDFLQFASQAHGYRKMRHSTDEMTPDMATAIQVLDREGGQ
jgi:hypothetical protein